MRFDELDLEDEILDGLYDMNFQEMTPVQEHTIPVILGTLRTDESITPNIFIAITLLAMLPSIIVYLGLQKHFNRGIMSGAVKG